MRIYGDERSGNCLKVRWLADHLAVDYEWVQMDTLAGAAKTPKFLALNPVGQIPLVLLDDGRTLSESNAILLYLADGTDLVPAERFERARVHEWLFWEQYSHEPYLAVRRRRKHLDGLADEDIDPMLLVRGNEALRRLEMALADATYLIGDRPTVADICLFPYTALAHEGGFNLEGLPSVRRWLRDVRSAFPIRGLGLDG